MDNIIKNNINVQKFSEEILENSKVKSDLFWDRVEQNLLKALILYVTTEYSERERNLSSIYSLLGSNGGNPLQFIGEMKASF